MATLISSPYISFVTLSLGLALFILASKSLRLVGLWFIAEFMCDLVTTGLNEYASDLEIVTYMYLYAITALMFSVWALENPKVYSRKIIAPFVFLSILSVAFVAYRYPVQSRWFTWGEGFYFEFGISADLTYFLLVLAMDAILIILGVHSALDTNTNANDGIRGKR